MPIRPGVPELLIVMVIVILLFGVGKISKIASELGKGIRSFRDGLQTAKVEKEDEIKNQPEKF